YLRYVGKTFWPADLAAIYPYPESWPQTLVATSALLVIGGCAFTFLLARRRPYFFTGWLWFIGMLVPAIGIVQVGVQSMADRYSYLPSIGLFILLVWGAADLAEICTRKLKFIPDDPLASAPRPVRHLLSGASAIALAGCTVCTFLQLQYWC